MRRLLLATTMVLGLTGVGHASQDQVAQEDALRTSSYIGKCVASKLGNAEPFDIDLAFNIDETGATQNVEVVGASAERMVDRRFSAFANTAVSALMAYNCARLPLPASAQGRSVTLTNHIPLRFFGSAQQPQPQARPTATPTVDVASALNPFLVYYRKVTESCKPKTLDDIIASNNMWHTAVAFAGAKGWTEKQVTDLRNNTVAPYDASACDDAIANLPKVTKRLEGMING